MAFREVLLAEFDHEVAATRRLLSLIPASAMEWRPHAQSRSFGELSAHVTEILSWSKAILDLETFDLADADLVLGQPAWQGSAVERFAAAAADARHHLDKSDGELTALWTCRQDGREVFAVPRAAAFRTFVLAHVVHHRGQLSVYLRLNDIAVPPIYGPTATSVRRKNP